MKYKHQVIIDKEKNRIFLQLKGFMQDDEIIEASNKVKEGFKVLKPNFDIINDISEFSPATKYGREIIKETQIMAVKNGVGRVVRVVGNVIGQIQFERTSKEAGYTAVSVSNLQTAYDYLDNKLS